MPSIEILITFITATILFAYIPGPALLYASAQTVARGRRAGLMASLGLHIGGYFHVFAATLGLSALFHSVPILYMIIKIVGALYLVYLGFNMLKSAFINNQQSNIEIKPIKEKSVKRAFFESVTVEVLNPKTAIFFIAFLPQFIDPLASFPIWLQFLILGVIVNVILASADLVCVYFAGYLVDKLRESTTTAKVMEGIGGTILVGLGTHLVLQKN